MSNFKEHDIVKFVVDSEFEAIDGRDNPIGMRVFPKGLKATVVSITGQDKGWVEVDISAEDWQEDWGVNDVLSIQTEELEAA